MADENALNFKKGLLKKDKLELVKILKSKNQPTNGSKADLVDRILAYDEKNGGKMARKASKADNDPPPAYEEDDDEEEGEAQSKPIKKKPKKKRKESNYDDDDDDGRGGGGGIDCGDCGGGGCAPALGGGPVGFAQIATALAAVGQLILGIIQFILLAEYLEEVCDEDTAEALTDGGLDTSCCGNSLYWEYLGTDGHYSYNTAWRDVFTLRPSYFFANWTPMLFGLLAIMQMFNSTSWDLLSGGWLRCMFFHIVMFLFAAFGYCGKAGIIIGFIQVFAAFMCLVMCFVNRGGANTYITWNY